MAFLAPIQYWICGYCSWQAMKNLERQILWRKHSWGKSPSQMKIDFSQPFFQQSAMLSEDSEGERLWCFWVVLLRFGFFFLRDEVPLRRSALPKPKIPSWGNLSGTWDPHVLSCAVTPELPLSSLPKQWRAEEMSLLSQGKLWDLGTCLQLALCRDRYSFHGFTRHFGEFLVKWFKQHHVWDQGESQLKSNGPAAAWFGGLIMGQSLTHLGHGSTSISAAYEWQGPYSLMAPWWQTRNALQVQTGL